jgi:hypothetical protein
MRHIKSRALPVPAGGTDGPQVIWMSDKQAPCQAADRRRTAEEFRSQGGRRPRGLMQLSSARIRDVRGMSWVSAVDGGGRRARQAGVPCSGVGVGPGTTLPHCSAAAYIFGKSLPRNSATAGTAGPSGRAGTADVSRILAAMVAPTARPRSRWAIHREDRTAPPAIGRSGGRCPATRPTPALPHPARIAAAPGAPAARAGASSPHASPRRRPVRYRSTWRPPVSCRPSLAARSTTGGSAARPQKPFAHPRRAGKSRFRKRSFVHARGALGATIMSARQKRWTSLTIRARPGRCHQARRYRRPAALKTGHRANVFLLAKGLTGRMAVAAPTARRLRQCNDCGRTAVIPWD